MRIFFISIALAFASVELNCIANETAAPLEYTEHQNLSYYLRADGSRAQISTADDWQHRRRHIVQGMEAAMGPLPRPARPVPLDVKILEVHKGDGFVRRWLSRLYHRLDPYGKRLPQHR